jgi:hypothetical protein
MQDKPTPPGEYDCCESGCEPCIWDTYNEKMAAWRAAEQKARQDREALDTNESNSSAS